LVIDGYLLNPHTILEFIQLVTVVAWEENKSQENHCQRDYSWENIENL
jgi:hypothetical protein